MEKAGFKPKVPVYQMVCTASDAMHRLSVELHYRSCKSGLGRPNKNEPRRELRICTEITSIPTSVLRTWEWTEVGTSSASRRLQSVVVEQHRLVLQRE
jgi:hypothetical protein